MWFITGKVLPAPSAAIRTAEEVWQRKSELSATPGASHRALTAPIKRGVSFTAPV